MRVSAPSCEASRPREFSANADAPASSPVPGEEDHLNIGPAPFFSDGLLARAKANYNKIAAANSEPLALAKAIREHYVNHPLVLVLQDTLHEISARRGYECGFKFCGPTGLILTRYGFRSAGHRWNEAQPYLAAAVDVGTEGSCAAARKKLDAQLAAFAEDPEESSDYVEMDPEDPAVQPSEPVQPAVSKRRKVLHKLPFFGRKR